MNWANLQRILAQRAAPHYDSTDAQAFGITAGIVFVVYLATIPSDITLGMPGTFATGAYYAGVPHTPGFPLWTLYGWFFSNALPISNIAWRLSVSSAFASAMTCGCVAWIVSRSGALIFATFRGGVELSDRQCLLARIVCGCVAGTVLGFSRDFWRKSLIPDPWPLSLLLLSLVVCLLMRWMLQPGATRFLLGAFFIYGLALTNSYTLLAAGPGIVACVCLGNNGKGRDLLILGSVLFFVWAALDKDPFGSSLSLGRMNGYSLSNLIMIAGFCTILGAIALALRTYDALTEWKATLGCAFVFVAGLAILLFVPLTAMTNPPVNWGYSRVVEGFRHNLSRNHYESPRVTNRADVLAKQLHLYAHATRKSFGTVNSLAAASSFFLLFLTRGELRRWLSGLLFLYATMTFLLVAVLAPGSSRESIAVASAYFSATHVVLALCLGMGLMLITVLARKPN